MFVRPRLIDASNRDMRQRQDIARVIITAGHCGAFVMTTRKTDQPAGIGRNMRQFAGTM
jgi:hypothetical protein